MLHSYSWHTHILMTRQLDDQGPTEGQQTLGAGDQTRNLMTTGESESESESAFYCRVKLFTMRGICLVHWCNQST